MSLEHPNKITVGAACLKRWNNESRHSSQRRLDYCAPSLLIKGSQHSPGTVLNQNGFNYVYQLNRNCTFFASLDWTRSDEED